MAMGMSIADKTERLFTALKPLVNSVQAQLRKFRIPLTVIAAIIFVVGGVWSFLNLNLSIATLDIGALLLLAGIAPIVIVYSGIGLVLLAKAAGTSIHLRKAIPIAIFASLAEALPLPGGAIVRTGALVSAGARVGQSSILVIVTAALWIALAATGAALYVTTIDKIAGVLLAIPAFTLCLALFGWLSIKAGFGIAGLTLLHRIVGMVLTTIRLKLAFMVVGVNLSLAETLPFAFATISGSAAAIAPAGLGISETLSALLATIVATAPAAAFLAVAVGRIVGLATTAILAVIIQLIPQKTVVEDSQAFVRSEHELTKTKGKMP